MLIVQQSLRDIIQDLGAVPMPPCRIACLPARAERDELAGSMLAHLLQHQGSEAWSAPGKLAADELLGLLEKVDANVVCISVVETLPSSIPMHPWFQDEHLDFGTLLAMISALGLFIGILVIWLRRSIRRRIEQS